MTDDIIDYAMLDDLRQSMQDKFRATVEKMLDDAEHMITIMGLSAAQGHWEEMAKAAHLLKSSSGQVGALHLYKCAREIEYMHGHGDHDGIILALHRVHDEFVVAKSILQSVV